MLKLQYFGYLMWRANKLEKTLMLGKIEGKRRKGWQSMRWLDSITDSVEIESCSVMSNFLLPHGLYSTWNSPSQNTRVGSLSLLQGIFPTQGLNLGLLCRQILYQLSHKGSPRILEWVAYPFSRGSSWPRNRTRVSCIAGRYFTNWAIREALGLHKWIEKWSGALSNPERGKKASWHRTQIRDRLCYVREESRVLLPETQPGDCSS